MINNTLTCLFGFHNYSKKLITDKSGYIIYLCTICKRRGYFKSSSGYTIWIDYDDKGNETHFKDVRGYEYWYEYDDKGNNIYRKDNDGDEYWYDYDDKGNEIHWKDNHGNERWLYNGQWVDIKPEN